MSQPVPMPALGESVTEGTVTRWLKAVGDTVAVDEPIVEISTDKVDTELPSPVAGVLLQILVAEDQVAQVGDILAQVGEPGSVPDAAPAAPVEAPPAAPEPAAPVPDAAPAPQPVVAPEPVVAAPVVEPEPAPAPSAAAPEPEPAPAASGTEPGYVTPLVRKLAAETGVDLSTVVGTGVGGRLRREDVLAAAAPAPAPAAPVAPVAPAPAGGDPRLPRLRSMTAERELQDARVVQRTSVAEVDVSTVVAAIGRAKEAFRQREGIELTVAAFYAKVTVEALKANPVFNAAIIDDDITYYAQENLAVTVPTAAGAVSAVIGNAGTLALVGMAHALAAVTARAQGGALLPDDLLGGTFTLTSPASPDVMLEYPVVDPPQVGILSMAQPRKRAVVVGDGIAIRWTSFVSLSYDPRLLDSSDAGAFLGHIKDRLEGSTWETELGL
ncbi:MAG: 2-oxo acid dehydrogenase subunit E2 [Bifidobacteriaceae bacterium]|jgi:2-oxoglutarate dehydrogenase E2 component (dihydrolipoamide succinyltransferase)|nr:2-oxo acid dehydrogenase subunit E2 [Bifidobacteriaceae bacterium]